MKRNLPEKLKHPEITFGFAANDHRVENRATSLGPGRRHAGKAEQRD
jgi:hypothetical protein